MTNPTSNFGWQMPTSTDLVTDLPADFEVFGQAVDTSLADLKGGSTGQVLSKNSNTDMDFVWVTSDDANAIQNTIVDAKGDLIAASAADTPARLAVGNNGETLVADSSTATGLRWTGTPSASNPIINGAFDVWQRGTSIACGTSFVYTADRFSAGRGGFAAGQTVSRQAAQNSALPFVRYSFRSQRDSGNTSTADLLFGTALETSDSVPFAGKTVTVSFYARVGANYSGTAAAIVFYSGTTTDEGGALSRPGFSTGNTIVLSQSYTPTTTWQRFTFTGTLAATVTQLAFNFSWTPSGTAGANDWLEITGMQLDVGSVALPFRRNGGTIQGELAACQRYYEKSYDQATAPGTSTFNGIYWASGSAASATTSYLNTALRFAVTKRNVPSITFYDAVGNANQCTRSTLGVGDNNAQAVTAGQIGNTGSNVYSTGTSNTTFMFHYVASSEL